MSRAVPTARDLAREWRRTTGWALFLQARRLRLLARVTMNAGNRDAFVACSGPLLWKRPALSFRGVAVP